MAAEKKTPTERKVTQIPAPKHTILIHGAAINL
jgi:hypothetical protein